jgi:hypothetical protein
MTSWKDDASAIVNMFLKGEATGNAWAGILFSKVNPQWQYTISPCPAPAIFFTAKAWLLDTMGLVVNAPVSLLDMVYRTLC